MDIKYILLKIQDYSSKALQLFCSVSTKLILYCCLTCKPIAVEDEGVLGVEPPFYNLRKG